MKVKAAISQDAHQEVFAAFGSERFYESVMKNVIGGALGVETPEDRPAEFYIQLPDPIVTSGNMWGVEVRLTGTTRNGRTAKQLHKALKRLDKISSALLASALPEGKEAQLFVVIMIDGAIETYPGSGVYSNVIESKATWIDGSAS